MSGARPAPRWRPMAPADLPAVAQIAGQVHAAYPERPEVPAERLRLFPAGCAVAAGEGAILGYAIAHPWTLGPPPALDTLLGCLPATPACLYLHDVALLTAARGGGLGTALVDRLRALAAHERLPTLALVAVHGSVPFWRRHGFAAVVPDDPAVAAKLRSYGPAAALMRAAA